MVPTVKSSTSSLHHNCGIDQLGLKRSLIWPLSLRRDSGQVASLSVGPVKECAVTGNSVLKECQFVERWIDRDKRGDLHPKRRLYQRAI